MVYLNFLQHDRFPVTVAQHGAPPGRADVADPVGVLAEHGNQVPAVVVVGDDRRKRDRSAGAAPGDLNHDQPPGPGAGRGQPGPAARSGPWPGGSHACGGTATAVPCPRTPPITPQPGQHRHPPAPDPPAPGAKVPPAGSLLPKRPLHHDAVNEYHSAAVRSPRAAPLMKGARARASKWPVTPPIEAKKRSDHMAERTPRTGNLRHLQLALSRMDWLLMTAQPGLSVVCVEHSGDRRCCGCAAPESRCS